MSNTANNIIATDEQLKKLKQQPSDFNYMDFLMSDNQVQYFQNHIINTAIKSNAVIHMKLMYIKQQLRNIDWFFLSKTGLLQDDFITLVLSKDWMNSNGLINPNHYYIPIKILHYLNPIELCRNHDLTKIVQDALFDINQFTNDTNSQSSISDSSILKSAQGMLFEKILRILHEDRIQYSNGYIERSFYNASQNNNEYKDIIVGDTTVNVEKCVFDDFVEYIHPSALCSQNNSSYYMTRFSQNKYLIQDADETNAFTGFATTIPEPILSFTTVDKKYMELYQELTWKYTENDDGSVSSSSVLSMPKMYIADQYRNCGLDRITLLKYQSNLPLQFVCKYYTMNEICKYYRFTPKLLLDNKEGLVITYDNKNNTEKIPYQLETLFLYNTFDMQDNNMIDFVDYYKEQIQQNQNIKNTINLYQKIIDTDTGVVFNNNSNYSSILGNSDSSLAQLQPINKKFIQHTKITDAGSPLSIKYNLSGVNVYLKNGAQDNLTNKYNYNIIMTNTINSTKLNILKMIYFKAGQENNHLYFNATLTDENGNNYIPIIDQDETDQDENPKYYINVCVRCHKKQFCFSDAGTGRQYQLKTKLSSKLNDLLNPNNTQTWKNGQFVGGWYTSDNNTADNQGYIVCGLYNFMYGLGDCASVLKARVYLDDIIALLDNGFIACKKVKIMNNNLYQPQYIIAKDNSTSNPNHFNIKTEKFVEFSL